jgi:hypothetical protein
MSVQRKPLSDLLSISFNQDAGCFCCGMVDGFRVMNSEPLTEAVSCAPLAHSSAQQQGSRAAAPHAAPSCAPPQYRRDFQGGVGVAEMVFRWNILALVGGGPAPKWPREKVMIWDDKERRPIGELAFRTSVRAVRLRKDRIAVALEHRVLLYDMEELRVVHEAETAPNPGGLLALSPAAGSAVLACPGLHAGQVRVELLDTRRTRFVDAHSSGLAALALCASGRLLATASGARAAALLPCAAPHATRGGAGAALLLAGNTPRRALTPRSPAPAGCLQRRAPCCACSPPPTAPACASSAAAPTPPASSAWPSAARSEDPSGWRSPRTRAPRTCSAWAGRRLAAAAAQRRRAAPRRGRAAAAAAAAARSALPPAADQPLRWRLSG